jgi:hypothetical protein
MDWDGHANVESAANAKSVMYLYDYLYKGQRKVKVTICNGVDVSEAQQEEEKDEIKLYLNARFICAMDAWWRILAYPTYPATSPSVATIKIKSPDQVTFLREKNLSCDMLAYLNRPPELAAKKYTELFQEYLTGMKCQLNMFSKITTTDF